MKWFAEDFYLLLDHPDLCLLFAYNHSFLNQADDIVQALRFIINCKQERMILILFKNASLYVSYIDI
jgi:hypothetical protein